MDSISRNLARLILWSEQDGEFDPNDDAHRWLQDVDCWDWCDLSGEVTTIARAMLKGFIREDGDEYDDIEGWVLDPDIGPIAVLISATAAAANRGAYNAVGAMLGVDSSALKNAASYWEETHGEPPTDIPKPRPALRALLEDYFKDLNDWIEQCDREEAPAPPLGEE